MMNDYTIGTSMTELVEYAKLMKSQYYSQPKNVVLDCTPSTGSITIYEFMQDHTNQNYWHKGELFCAQKVVYTRKDYIEIKGIFISSQFKKVTASVIFSNVTEFKEKLRLCKKNEHLNVRRVIAGIDSSKIVHKLKDF